MTFTLKTRIYTSAKEIYEHWLSSEGHANMTGAAATISNTIGSHFTAWDGYIEGKNIELESNKRILQSWRTTQFEEQEEDSQVEILFTEIDDATEITLIHSNLSEDGEHYKKGWEDFYFQPMKDYFMK